MTIVGFNYTKMAAEKNSAPKGELKVNISLKISDVKEANVGIGNSNSQGLNYTFEFLTKYNPDVGSIILQGNILELQDKKVVTKILKEWKKDKKLDQEHFLPIYNNALNRCSIQAIILSKEMGLPSPIPLLRKGQ